MRYRFPPFCKVRKGRGTHYFFAPARFKNLGYPPNEWVIGRPSRRDRLSTIRAKFVRNFGFGVRSHVVLKGLPIAFFILYFFA